MKLSDERLKEIRERAGKATPGPWTMSEPRDLPECPNDHGWGHAPCNDLESETATVMYGERGPFPAPVIHSVGYDADSVEAKLEDIHFIAHARADIPDLLEALEEARAELRELRERERASLPTLDNTDTLSVPDWRPLPLPPEEEK